MLEPTFRVRLNCDFCANEATEACNMCMADVCDSCDFEHLRVCSKVVHDSPVIDLQSPPSSVIDLQSPVSSVIESPYIGINQIVFDLSSGGIPVAPVKTIDLVVDEFKPPLKRKGNAVIEWNELQPIAGNKRKAALMLDC